MLPVAVVLGRKAFESVHRTGKHRRVWAEGGCYGFLFGVCMRTRRVYNGSAAFKGKKIWITNL